MPCSIARIGAVRGAVGGPTFPEDGWPTARGCDATGSMNGTGCAVLEASDRKLLFELVSEWQEFLEVEATPVVEEDDAGAILNRLYG